MFNINIGVGKSCLLLQFTEHIFKKEHEATIGVEFGSRIIEVKNRKIKLQVWDTAGQESFKSITRSYYRGAIGAIVVYDITKRTTFENIHKWLEETRNCSGEKITIVLVGNKLDQEEKREITYNEGQDFALKNGLFFFETSAKTAMNVDEVFSKSAENILDRLDQGDLDPNEDQGIKVNKMSKKNTVQDKRLNSKCGYGCSNQVQFVRKI